MRSGVDLVQVRSQRSVAEVLLPQPRRQLRDSAGGVLADALEDVDEVGIRIDLVQWQVAIRLCTMPTCLAPSSVQQNSQFLRLCGSPHKRNYAQRRTMQSGAFAAGCGVRRLGTATFSVGYRLCIIKVRRGTPRAGRAPCTAWRRARWARCFAGRDASTRCRLLHGDEWSKATRGRATGRLR